MTPYTRGCELIESVSKTGKKAELVARLEDDDATQSPHGDKDAPQEAALSKATKGSGNGGHQEEHAMPKSNETAVEDLEESAVPAETTEPLVHTDESTTAKPAHDDVVGGRGESSTIVMQDPALLSTAKKQEPSPSRTTFDVQNDETVTEFTDKIDANTIDTDKDGSVQDVTKASLLPQSSGEIGSDDASHQSNKLKHEAPKMTVTEKLVADIQAPSANNKETEEDTDVPFDTANAPGAPMALNQVSPRNSVIPMRPPDVETNDPSILKRQREENEIGVENDVSKKLKHEVGEEPIGGSALLKEEVPAYKDQVASSSRDQRPIYYEHEQASDETYDGSLHPKSAAIYVKELTRPVNTEMFSEHLKSLTGEQPVAIYMDAIKSHAFVSFSTVDAACKARSGLHGKTWPNETNRKALWVDFIPIATVEDFAAQERQASRNSRFEVIYPTQNGVVIAKLQEIGTTTRQQKPTSESIPSDIRGSSNPNKKVIRLDDLFEKTSTKPVLYFKRSKNSVEDKLEST